MRIALSLFLLAGTASAQTTTIAPGMSREQVTDILGKPASERHFGAHDYLLFDAGCSRKCGDDLVILDHDRVVDAVIRSAGHTYAGAGEAPATLTGTSTQRPAPPAITAASAADSAHRSGMVFEGPRPPAAPPAYKVIQPQHHDSTASPH
jgi:hypothetical protein